MLPNRDSLDDYPISELTVNARKDSRYEDSIEYIQVQTYRHLFWCPDVKVNGLDLADMCTHRTMNARTSYTQKDTSLVGIKSEL